MKCLVISVRPKDAAAILNGEMDRILLARPPKLDGPIYAYLYCNKRGSLFEFSYHYKPRFEAIAERDMDEARRKALASDDLSGFVVGRALLTPSKFRGGFAVAWMASRVAAFEGPIELGALGARKPPRDWIYADDASV